MTYIALTQGTADWLLGKTGLLDILHDILVQPDKNLSVLRDHIYDCGIAHTAHVRP